MLTGSIMLATKFLAGFNLANMTTRGEILLPTNTEGGDEDDPFRGSGHGLQYYPGETMVARDKGRTINISSIVEVPNS